MKLTAFVAAALLGTTAMAQTADAPKPTWTFALHGFVSATGGLQTGTFSPSEGQLSNYATTAAPSATNPVKDKDSFTFDVRHSRFNFSVKGPQSAILGATPTGILEIDFMGGFGAGANGNTSLLNRLRVAVAELAWPGNKVQFGQQNDLIFAMAPTSLSHIGQPIGYGTGNIGFRRPGVFGYHTLSLAKDLSVELAWEIGRASWNDAGPALSVSTPSNGISSGEASGGPAFEGRATVNYAKLLNVWVAGHQHRVDLTGVGNVAAPTNAGASPAGPLPQTLTVATLNGGFKATVDVAPIAITLAGTGFVAQNAGTLSGNLGSGFAFGPRGNQNVDSSGYWAQLGVNLTKEFSLWGFYGQQWVAKQDFVFANGGDAAAAAGKAYENTTTNVIAMYRDASGIALSLEWINFATKYPKDAAAIDAAAHKITASRTAKADQYLASVNYFF